MSSDAVPPPVAPVALDAAEANRRTWCMLAHLSALAGFIGIPLGNVLGPLIVWQIKKHEMPEVEVHAKDAMNFQITMLIAVIVSILLVFIFIGVLLLFAVGILALVCTIIAAVKANNGERWKYPVSIQFLK